MEKSICHNPAGLVSLSAAHSSFLSLTKPNFTSCPNQDSFQFSGWESNISGPSALCVTFLCRK